MSKYNELNNLEKIIDNMDEGLRRKYLKWIKLSNGYLQFEKNFKPEKIVKYNPGDVLTVNFGFNVGAEFGGRHYAIVLEDNNRSAGTVTVIPLSSCTSEEGVKKPSVYLGLIEELNYEETTETHSYAIMNQIRAISKMRISSPTKPTEEKLNIGRNLLEKIYAVISDEFAGKLPDIAEPHKYTEKEES
ncbi:type II toxin-antitoxin system PemK/MazF family toxin [Ureibacillus sp. MALMAid1270]|uniref:type II toxin-antitoxin system PemK/MazF family toxin n=1 Tax=Ureibacillus sp. MALMAid1270 TaxID=3411629 RepID=UPI003BA546B1